MAHSPLTSFLHSVVVEVAISDLQVRQSHIDTLRNLDAFPDDEAVYPFARIVVLLLDKIQTLQKDGRIISAKMASSLAQLGVNMNESMNTGNGPPPSAASLQYTPQQVNRYYSSSVNANQNLPPIQMPLPQHNVPPLHRPPPLLPLTSNIPAEIPDDPNFNEYTERDCIIVSSDEEDEGEEKEEGEGDENEQVEDQTVSSPISTPVKQPTKTARWAAKDGERLDIKSCPFCDKKWPRGIMPNSLYAHLLKHDLPGTFFRCSECPPDSYRQRHAKHAQTHFETMKCGGSVAYEYNPEPLVFTRGRKGTKKIPDQPIRLKTKNV